MYSVKKLDDDIFFLGVSDRRINLFENVYPVENGVSYNSYIIIDKKTCLIDTVDKSGEIQFKENLAYALSGRKLDYLVVQHFEPDHSATIAEIVKEYPEVTLVYNRKADAMAKNFFKAEFKAITVKEGDVLPLGKHTLHFVEAPMVHWPEVMFSYDDCTKTLFTADAFGSFGALSGNIYADEIDFKGAYTDEMRRYYTNIVGKYGVQVQSVLKKAASLEIHRICPLHGLIWRNNFNHIFDKYSAWSSYTPEVKGVLIAYASVYGNTANAAEIVAYRLSDLGIKNVATYDVSKTDCSYILAEAFKYSHIVIASTTYNAGIFVNMENFLNDLAAHGLKNRTYAIIENGSWAPTAGKLIREKLAALAGSEFIEKQVKILSSVKESTREELISLADAVAKSVKPDVENALQAEENGEIDKSAFFKLSYGLFVLSSGPKRNGCIVNTVSQLTENPKRLTVAVNKANYTCEQILETKKFNASVISESADFELFKRFGFQSGRDADKFDGFDKFAVSKNGMTYLTENVSAFFSADVVEYHDYGSHILFVAEVSEAKTLSDEKPMTYAYYFDNVKPKPQTDNTPKKGWVCKTCGYVYEGDELPEDFICPICKHGVDDFEKIG